MPEFDHLSDNLKSIRIKMKESQIDFAANCGISTEILSLMERKRTDPKLSTLQKIAAYTNMTVSELLSRRIDED